MRLRNSIQIVIFFLLTVLVLLNYQNCAPLPKGAASADSPSATGDSLTPVNNGSAPVTTIDDVLANSKVSFVKSSLVLDPDANAVDLAGVCSESQDGATLRWDLMLGGDGAILDHGFVGCAKAAFTVSLSNLQNLSCGQLYIVRAQLGPQGAGEVSLVRDCPTATEAAQ